MVTVSSFKFNIVWSVFATKLETSNSQKSAILNYKVDTGSDGNLIPVNMF